MIGIQITIVFNRFTSIYFFDSNRSFHVEEEPLKIIYKLYILGHVFNISRITN